MKIFEISFIDSLKVIRESGKKWLLRKYELRGTISIVTLDSEKVIVLNSDRWEFLDNVTGSFAFNTRWNESISDYQLSLKYFLEINGFNLAESASFEHLDLDLDDWTHRIGLLLCLQDKRLIGKSYDESVKNIQTALENLIQRKEIDLAPYIGVPYFEKIIEALRKRIEEIKASYSNEMLELNQQFVVEENQFKETISNISNKVCERQMQQNTEIADRQVQISWASEKGRRTYQEDTLAARIVTVDPSWNDRIPELLSCVIACAVAKVYQTLDFHHEAGTTATLLLSYQGKIYTAWIGDSKALHFVRDQKTQEVRANYLNWPHRLADPSKKNLESLKFEIERIKNEGGYVTIGRNQTFRLNFLLQTSRNIGNDSSETVPNKSEVIYGAGSSDLPCISVENISEETVGFLVCSDGLSDVMTCEEIGKEITFESSQNENSYVNVAASLVNRAYEKGSSDNITAVFAPNINTKDAIFLSVYDGHSAPNDSSCKGEKLAKCSAFFITEVLLFLASHPAQDLNKTISECLNWVYPSVSVKKEDLSTKIICKGLNFIATNENNNNFNNPDTSSPNEVRERVENINQRPAKKLKVDSQNENKSEQEDSFRYSSAP